MTVTGTNDAPVVISADGSGTVSELPHGDPDENNRILSDTGTIAFEDVDLSDIHGVSVAENGAGYRGSLTAAISDAATGEGAGEVTWTFSADDAALNDLSEGETVVQTYNVTVDDGHGGTATQTVAITLVGAADNTPPIANAAILVTDEDVTVSGTLTATDPDPDDINFAIVPGSELGGAITSFDSDTGDFTFTPTPNYSGTASFQFTADDGTETSAQAIATVDVSPVADVPFLAVDVPAAEKIKTFAAETTVNQESQLAQLAPQVIQLSDGRVLFTWHGFDIDVDGDNTGISARVGVVDSDGNIAWDSCW